jgi:D-2-hydroxyacid dehydrogenase (NADP+)
MTGLLVSRPVLAKFGDEIAQAAAAYGLALEHILVPEQPDERVSPDDCARIEIAFFSGDVFPRLNRPFFAATLGAPNLKWMHVFNAGVDDAVFGRFLERGVRLTTSSGSTAAPIAQTAIGGMLMLARGFPRWLDAQRRHAWETLPRAQAPADLRGQTMVVIGLGAIGSEIARLARAIGLWVIGVRRRPLDIEDPVDELHHPAKLADVLPRADWLALACPLTDETRRMIDARALALLPRGARILNVARGEVIDEAALIEALRGGQIGGAYLDVFETEPLPADSPLWDLPNVIVTPHNSAVSSGNDSRAAAIFVRNLRHWAHGEPLVNEVTAP